MKNLIRAGKGLAQNSKKGFTLMELIIVIVIIAILVAALVPAIIGAIERANNAANMADARTIFTAASVAAIDPMTGAPRAITVADVQNSISGGFRGMRPGMTFVVYLDSPAPGVVTGVSWTGGRTGSPTGDIGERTGNVALTITIS